MKENYKVLNFDSTLADLSSFSSAMEITSEVTAVINKFNLEPLIPGVILYSRGNYRGMLSRQRFFECMSRPYSRELYLKRPVSFLSEDNPSCDTLILPSSMTISEAAYLSVSRSGQTIYEPLVVQFSEKSHRLIDIHQLLLAQSEIHLKTVESLREANEFKTEILGIAAHDLKNPLNSIIGFSNLIRDESGKGNETIREMACSIFRSSMKMLELIGKLLDASAIELGKIELNFALTGILSLCEEIVNNNRHLAAAKMQRILFRKEIPEEFALKCDRIRLQESIDNLISNAIKYSPIGGIITVTLSSSNDSMRFEVSDEGPGIREKEKSKLFGRFQRLSARPTGGETSTGLGLYIVRQTINLHGGKIWVENNEPAGSRFIIELPIHN